MIKFFALVALAALASAATLSEDFSNEQSSLDEGRIIGGTTTTIQEAPHQVSLHIDGNYNCGGSIISEYWVVTAGHCVPTFSHSSVTIRAGSTDVNKSGSLHFADVIITHKGYVVNKSGGVNNDVALIRVTTPFTFDDTREAIELFNSDEKVSDEDLAEVTGWGVTEFGTSSPTLRKVTVPIVNKKQCNQDLQVVVPEGQICAGYVKGGKDSCNGDSGGPLVVNDRLAGIVSWGKGCAKPESPGVYTEVAAYRKWIDEQKQLFKYYKPQQEYFSSSEHKTLVFNV